MTAPPTRSGGTVLAVLVLYGRPPEKAASWSTILALLGGDGPLRLGHCLVHDNSPERHVSAAPASDISVRWTPDNPGTAGAYVGATEVAHAHGCDWLLLLDQDTVLPVDYLDRATRALDQQEDVAALVPRIWHGHDLVSPATIGKAGGVRPTTHPAAATGIPTAISSGMLVRHSAFVTVPPFPSAIWLDYVDHWICLSFARSGLRIGLIDADLSHDLSIRSPNTLSLERLAGILAAENTFNHAMVGGESYRLRLRRLTRAVRYAAHGQFAHARTIIQYTLAHTTPS